MNNNSQTNPWSLIDEGFDSNQQADFENRYALGNGYIRQLANFEEYYSGASSLGTSINGISLSPTVQDSPQSKPNADTEKSRNAPDWTRITIRLNEEVLDLASWAVQSFKRELNLRDGVLERNFVVTSLKGHQIEVTVQRFLSLDKVQVGAISYKVKSLNFNGRISFMPLIDGDILNYQGEPAWNILQVKTDFDVACLRLQIRRKETQICSAMSYDFLKNNEPFKVIPAKIEKEKQVGYSVGCDVKTGESVMLNKYVVLVDSNNYPRLQLPELACKFVLEARAESWKSLLKKHRALWNDVWTNWESKQEQPENVLSSHLYEYFNTVQNTYLPK